MSDDGRTTVEAYLGIFADSYQIESVEVFIYAVEESWQSS
jgi:hypothetical protein